jgi:hypothetical protein
MAPAPNPNYIGPNELIIRGKNLPVIIGPGGGAKIEDRRWRIEDRKTSAAILDLLSTILDRRPDHANPRGFTAQFNFSA